MLLYKHALIVVSRVNPLGVGCPSPRRGDAIPAVRPLRVPDDVGALLRGQERVAGAGMTVLATALAARALALPLMLIARRASAQQYPLPSLEGGLEEFLAERAFCSSSCATRADRASSWVN